MPSFSVFTKPWKTESVDELAAVVSRMGFDAVEFPLRPGFQAEPDNVQTSLPALAHALREHGIRIDDVASTPTEPVFSACARAEIPMIRIMFQAPQGDYYEAEQKFLESVAAAEPLCRQYGVKLGIQMHCGRGASNAAALLRVVSPFAGAHVGAIWDAAHAGLAGDSCEQSIDLLYDQLFLVNFKNARWRMGGRDMDGAAVFKPFFCPGADGQCSWPRAVRHLQARGYTGTWCMPAEYDDAELSTVEAYAARDLTWLKTLVGA